MLYASNLNRASFGIAVNEIQRSLGDVPNDAEAAYDMQYTPVRQGWYVGYPVTGGGYQSRNSCSNLGADAAATSSQSTAETALAQLAKHQRFQAAMQVIGTMSILAVASVAVAKAISESRSKSTLGRRRRRK